MDDRGQAQQFMGYLGDVRDQVFIRIIDKLRGHSSEGGCLDWQTTETALREAHAALSSL